MRSDAIVIVGVGFQDPTQMHLAQDNDVVHALTPDPSPGTAMEPEFPIWFQKALFAALTPIALLQDYRLAMPPMKLGAPPDKWPAKSNRKRTSNYKAILDD
jgi:hypothetical protein